MSFVDDLKTRKVFRATFAYAVGAFAVIQIIEPLMHGLRQAGRCRLNVSGAP